eukprot:gene4471-5482_t
MVPVRNGLIPALIQSAAASFRTEGISPNPANTGVLYHHGTCYALWEGGMLVRLEDVASLRTAAASSDARPLRDLKEQLKTSGTIGFTAHPKVCPETGELLFMGYNSQAMGSVTVGCLAADGTLKNLAVVKFPSRSSKESTQPLLHDLAITQRHVVLIDQSVNVRISRFLKGQHPLGFDQQSPMRFGLVPRDNPGGPVQWFELETASSLMHIVNAFEQLDSRVVLIGCRIAHLDLIPAGRRELRTDPGVLTEWVIDPRCGTVTERMLNCAVGVDFPRVNDSCMSKPFRFSYLSRMPGASSAEGVKFDALVKYDLAEDESVVHEMGDSRQGYGR